MGGVDCERQRQILLVEIGPFMSQVKRFEQMNFWEKIMQLSRSFSWSNLIFS